jgi:hypothetical protein
MVTDERFVEGLRELMRAAVDEVHPPAGRLDGVAPARRWHLRAPSLGNLLAGVAIATAIAVAALALVLLTRGRNHLPQSSTLSPAAAASPTSLAQLQSALAILRRAQRPDDKIPAWGIAAEERIKCSNCLNVAELIPRESRLLATISLQRPYGNLRRERVYLVLGTVPESWQHGLNSGWHQGRKARGALHLSLVGLGLKDTPHIEQPIDELLNSAQLPLPIQALTPRDVLITSFETVGVVPDGVTRVKWELANPGQRTPVTIYPRVRGNVASAPWTRAPRYTSLINEQLLVGATWYGPNGRVVASYATTTHEIDRAHGQRSKPLTGPR